MKAPENNVTEVTEITKPAEIALNNSAPVVEKDLLAQLQEATEKKPDPKAKTVSETGTAQETKQPDQVAEAIKTPDVKVNDFRPPGIDAPAPTPVKPLTPYSEQAKLLIAFVDGLDCLIMPWGYQKTIFSRDELERLKEIAKRKESKSLKALQDTNDKDKELLARLEDYKKLIDDIPFTPAEIALIQSPLAAVMEKYHFNAGPESLLLGALFTVMAPRIMPLFNKIERL